MMRAFARKHAGKLQGELAAMKDSEERFRAAYMTANARAIAAERDRDEARKSVANYQKMLDDLHKDRDDKLAKLALSGGKVGA